MIWGKCITYLRENKNVALQMSCGDISDVEIVGDKFVAKTNEEYIYNIIATKYGEQEICKAFLWQGVSLKFEIQLVAKKVNKSLQDIQRLKEICEDYLLIKKRGD
ncbi:MAG: hypothetical protein RR400_00930 [Clostridia bacterium]